MKFTGKDLSGSRFGRLTVVELSAIKKTATATRYLWGCRCDCGNEKVVGVADLKSGKTRSCGCLLRETTIRRNTRHGMVGHPLYSTWSGMLQRCRDTNRRDSKHYSLKGVTVCERWKHFENFIDDVGDSYVHGLTLHRKISSIGYEPGNVIWADWKTQNSESENARIIEIDGESKTVTQWCEKTGIHKHTFYNRILRGWSERQAATTPKNVEATQILPSL